MNAAFPALCSTRWVSMLELGSLRKSDSQQPAQRGWEVALELPLFGPGPVPKAEALARGHTAGHPLVLATSAETGAGIPELRAEIAALALPPAVRPS